MAELYADAHFFHQSTASPVADVASRYYIGAGAGETVGGTTRLSSHTLYAVPFFSPSSAKVDALGLHVQTVATSGRAQLGIYAVGCASNLYPDGLILSGSEIATSSLGVQALPIYAMLLPALYWLAVLTERSPVVFGLTGDEPYPIFGCSANSFGRMQCLLVASWGYGLLPQTFPLAASATHSPPPALGLRYMMG